MRFIALLFLLIGSAFSQDVFPHPYVAGGINMSNAGYQTASGILSAGVDYQLRFVLADIYGQYDFGRKVNDNTVDNFKGHTRRLEGLAFVRPTDGKFFVGGGVNWAETSTTNYVKASGHPEVGGGYLFSKARFQAVYVLKGNDWQNEVKGIKAAFQAPIAKHLFVRGELGVYHTHDTITDPADASTTAMEKAHTHFFESVRLQMGWRF